KACVLPENPASYRVVRTKSYLFNKAVKCDHHHINRRFLFENEAMSSAVTFISLTGASPELT
ncbi:hypothetical protein V9Y50_06410, partial [Klebsiella pneumoniae]